MRNSKIKKIRRNKWLGIASMVAGAISVATSSSTFDYFGGLFLLTVGFALWWINR